jgi:hypothetical protein
MDINDIEVDEDGQVTLESAYAWMGKTPHVWKDSSGLWHAKVRAANGYATERESAHALISAARDEDYRSVHGKDRIGDAAWNPAISLEQITEDYMSVWGEVP